MSNKLFAVVLGGRAPKCNTELHDVVFAIAGSIEATYEQLMDQWLGDLPGLHLDSWVELDIVDGYEVEISDQAAPSGKQLYFVNLGAYADGIFGELHANYFLVANDKQEAKSRAKAMAPKMLQGPVHTDDLHEVDDCIAVECPGRHIALKTSNEVREIQPVNGYHIIPEAMIRGYLARRNLSSI